MTGISSFDTTVQKSIKIINEVGKEANIHDQYIAFQVLRYIMQTLRDRLPVNEASHIGAQLPNLLTGYYYEGWKPATVPIKDRNLEEFLSRVRAQLEQVDSSLDAEHCTKAVFQVLSNHVTPGEIEDILKIIPEELHKLWPEERRKKV